MRNKALAILIISALIGSASLWARTSASSAKPAVKKTSAKKSSAKSSSQLRKTKGKRGSWRTRGQKQIADDRTREIQTALVREGYLEGEPTGVMDTRTKSALSKLQADNGWQSKIVPDSRALIKLGLGPDQSNVLNRDTAALATPVTTPTTPVEGAGNQH